MNSLLFICWDGPQVSYLEGLFLPILKGLQDEYTLHVLQFTWGDEAKSSLIGEACARDGIVYTRYPVRRKPSVSAGTILTLSGGIRFIRKYVAQNAIGTVIYRGIFPSFMASRALRNNHSVYKVMDADGLPLEERVDFAGLNPRGFQYKFLKKNESRAIRRSAAVLVRTQATVGILDEGGKMADKFHVVVNGRDDSQFKPLTGESRLRIRAELGVDASSVLLVYGGSLAPQYCGPEMLRLLEILVENGVDAKFLVLTGNPELAEKWPLAPAVRDRLIVKSVPYNRMPGYLGAADIGLAIRYPFFSMIGVSPVKLGEYLLCGLPVIASKGIGDTGRILTGNNACFLLEDHSEASLNGAAGWIQETYRRPGIAEEARRTGLLHFSLNEGILSFRNALKPLK